jgi:hypothetical protein
MTRKVPRAKTVEGRPSFTLGDADHRTRKTTVAIPRDRASQPLELVPVPADSTPQQKLMLETINELVREANEED